jgi:hypothetical protein
MRRVLAGRLVGWLAGAAAVGLLVLSPAIRASGEPVYFHWVDAKGNLHVTDSLAEVPEPYQSLYQAKLRAAAEARERNGEGGAPAVRPEAPRSAEGASPPVQPEGGQTVAPETPGAPSVIDEEAARRQRWKELVAAWRADLEQSTAELSAAEEELGNAQMNPILRELPGARERIDAAQARRQQALERVTKARKMLLEELPARAKKELVPPAWLQ